MDVITPGVPRQNQSPTTTRPRCDYQRFYQECAEYPELPKFRRFAQQWAKKLYDDIEELLSDEKELNDAVATYRNQQGGVALTAIQCPRSVAVKGNDDLRRRWSAYEQKLRQYSQDLCLSQQLFQLPRHAPYFSKRLRNYSDLYHKGEFGPTGEENAALAYQTCTSPDFVAWVGIPGSDKLVNLYVNHSDWIEDNILRRIRSILQCRPIPRYGSQKTTVRYATLVMIFDILTSIFVPLLFTAIMFALVDVRSRKARIVVVGAFGLAFALSAKIFSGGISRGEIFAYSAAYFAVAAVFVSGTDDEIMKLV